VSTKINLIHSSIFINTRKTLFGKRRPQIQIGLPHILTYASQLTVRAGYERNFTTKEMIFPLNFPFICSNIPAAPAYGVYISQLMRYSRACGSYLDVLDRGLLLTRNLLNQGFLLLILKSSRWKYYGCHNDLVCRYGMSGSQRENHLFRCKVSFVTGPHSQLRGIGQDMRQTYLYLWSPLFQA
jgi:hypothetical protein